MNGHGHATPPGEADLLLTGGDRGRAGGPGGRGADRPGTLRRRLLGTVLGALALGLLLSGLGVHALLAHALVERHRGSVASAEAAVRLAVGAAGPENLPGVLREVAAAEGVERLVLATADGALPAQPRKASPSEPASVPAAAELLAASAFRAPATTFRLPVGRFDAADRPSGAELEVTIRSPRHANELARLDLVLGLILLGTFGLLAPAVVVAVFRLTAPLGRLREAVLLARRAGRSGASAAPSDRPGRSELLLLCRAVDALGADVAEARARLRTSNEELTQQVKARTAELSQANRQLEAEAADKNHFLRAVSHDLSAPLRNIDGLSRLLLSKHASELSEDAASRLERIGINVRHQHELINDLLELSKLRTRAHRPVELRLGELVDEVACGLGFDLENAGIEFEMTGAWPVVFAERNGLRQVFQNLIDNAIKYMMDSPVRRITAKVTREKDFESDIFEGLDAYRFAVTDTGRGIAEEDLASVFRVFSRSTHSGTHQVAGRGVGLACVEAIVRRYGGRVGVESTLGGGSTFWFTLPVAEVSARAAEEESRAAAALPAAA